MTTHATRAKEVNDDVEFSERRTQVSRDLAEMQGYLATRRLTAYKQKGDGTITREQYDQANKTLTEMTSILHKVQHELNDTFLIEKDYMRAMGDNNPLGFYEKVD